MVLLMRRISAGYFCFALFHNILSFSISAFIIGIGYGTLFPALQTIYNNMAAPSRRGTANSTYLTSFDVGIGLGMLIGAYIAQLYGYANMYVASALISFASLFIYWFNSRKIYERFKVI
jgi:predicted MFS family arabinose efflux permease